MLCTMHKKKGRKDVIDGVEKVMISLFFTSD
jgi:hypothetical protein